MNLHDKETQSIADAVKAVLENAKDIPSQKPSKSHDDFIDLHSIDKEKRRGSTPLTEKDIEEANEFTKAAAKAAVAGDDDFEFDGKKFPSEMDVDVAKKILGESTDLEEAVKVNGKKLSVERGFKGREYKVTYGKETWYVNREGGGSTPEKYLDSEVEDALLKLLPESTDLDESNKNQLLVKDLEKLIKNPDPSRVKEYGGTKYVDMLKSKLAKLQEAVVDIEKKVAKLKVGDKTNFGVVKAISDKSITFKAKDTPKTEIQFRQRKIGSRDYILDQLLKLTADGKGIAKEATAASTSIEEAFIDVDHADPRTPEAVSLLKKYKIKGKVLTMKGPGGMPLVRLTGKKKDLEGILKDPMGWQDDGFLAGFIEESLELEESEIDEAIYQIAEEENVDLDGLTEEQLDELIGKALKKVGSKIKKAVKGRVTTAGRAERLTKKADKIDKKQADRDKLKTAKKRLAMQKAKKKKLKAAKARLKQMKKNESVDLEEAKLSQGVKTAATQIYSLEKSLNVGSNLNKGVNKSLDGKYDADFKKMQKAIGDIISVWEEIEREFSDYNESVDLEEASIDVDHADPRTPEAVQLLKKYKIKGKVLTMKGPGGMPLVRLTGKKKDLEAILKDPDGWQDDGFLAGFIEESVDLEEAVRPNDKVLLKGKNRDGKTISYFAFGGSFKDDKAFRSAIKKLLSNTAKKKFDVYVDGNSDLVDSDSSKTIVTFNDKMTVSDVAKAVGEFIDSEYGTNDK